jgi:plastocyanin
MNGFLSTLALLVITSLLLMNCSAGPAASSPPATATPQSPGAAQPISPATAVTIKGFAFDPASVTVKVGTSVTWTNEDSAPHTISSDKGDWDSGRLAQGGTYTHKFDQAGTYAYHCAVHPSMTGTVVVTP